MNEDLQPARTEPLKIGVLISGSGTNLQALIDAIDAGTLNAQIVIVISSKPEAKGLLRAQKAGIQTLSLNPGVYENARVANTLIAEELQRARCGVRGHGWLHAQSDRRDPACISRSCRQSSPSTVALVRGRACDP